MTEPTSPLITADDLATKLGRPDLVLLDIRSSVDGGGRAAFEAGHIPGSRHADYVAAGWRVETDGAPGLLPSASHLSALFGRFGLAPESHAVVVPAGTSSADFSAAARIYWTLKVAGHRRLSILAGGFAGWAASGRPVETGPDRGEAGPPYPVAIDPTLRATTDEVAAIVADGGAALVDGRNPASFAGDEKSAQAKRAGRLPGALNVDSAQAYDPGANHLRSPAELDGLFARIPQGPVVAYCNTGQAAATGWFVLSEILGREVVTLYDGSMTAWTQDDARPVETGRG